MKLTILGSGDAFGSGGRFNTCFMLDTGDRRVLVDFGASSLVAMRARDVAPDSIDGIILTHLHGDHFGGLPWLLIDAQYVSKRTRPLVVAGPRGTEARFVTATEALYADSTKSERNFELSFIEYEERKPRDIGGVNVTAFEVKHPSGAPPYALRFECGGKVLAFTGDTGWVEVLLDVARDADLFISECFQYDVTLPIHLDYLTIDANYERLGAKRILLTHMGEAMLAASGMVDTSRYLIADDGMTLDL
jgi:ribonuclease BN (tRNA processing enzyme)